MHQMALRTSAGTQICDVQMPTFLSNHRSNVKHRCVVEDLTTGFLQWFNEMS